MKNKLILDYIIFLEKEIDNAYKRMYSKGITESEQIQLRIHLDSLEMALHSINEEIML